MVVRTMSELFPPSACMEPTSSQPDVQRLSQIRVVDARGSQVSDIAMTALVRSDI
jgi:hypothetical protein